MHENRETSVLAALSSPVQEGPKPKLDMNGTEESESAVVPMKEPNEGRPGRPEKPRHRRENLATAGVVRFVVNLQIINGLLP